MPRKVAFSWGKCYLIAAVSEYINSGTAVAANGAEKLYSHVMKSNRKNLYFEPHDTARAESLAGTALATFGRRSAAYLIDITVVFSSYAAAMEGLHSFLFGYLHISEDYYPAAHVKVHFDYEMTTHVAWALWLILYFGLIAWKTNGLTPGKRLMRIQIVSLTHERITLWQSIERALGYGASMLEGGFGFMQYFIRPNHCCEIGRAHV